MKTCNKCQQDKEIDNFYKSKTKVDGLDNTCKQCKLVYCRNRHKTKKEQINNYHKIYYNNNKEAHLDRGKIWKEQNKDKYQKYINNYSTLYYNKNIQYKLRKLLRGRISYELNKIIKGSFTEQMHFLLGCSLIEFKQYLESKFKPEMTWDNHGDIWEIDHIKPCSSFDLTDIEQQKECFHYTNLQPLFKTSGIAESFGYINEIGNRDKSNKI